MDKNGKHFEPLVEGWRYYFPTLFEIELEPAEGNAIIKHYTTTGKPLHGVPGFQTGRRSWRRISPMLLRTHRAMRIIHTRGIRRAQ